MVKIPVTLLLIISLFSLTNQSLAQSCNISISSSNLIAGQSYTISLNGGSSCTVRKIRWFVNTTSGAANGNSFSFTFGGAGTYDILIEATQSSGGGGGPGDNPNPLIVGGASGAVNNSTKPDCLCSATRTVTVQPDLPKLSTPSVNANIISCSTGNTTISVNNPNPNVTYRWYKGDENIGQGTSIPVSVSGSQAFKVKGSRSGYKDSDFAQTVVTSVPTFVPRYSTSISKSGYRNTRIQFNRSNGPFSGLTTYIQVNGANQSTDNLGTSYYFKEAGQRLQMQMYYSSGGCWSQKSEEYVTTDEDLILEPPLPQVEVIRRQFSEEILFTHQDAQHILNYATYYWVRSMDDEDTSNPFYLGYNIEAPGVYFLRGRDNESGTWGDALEINLSEIGYLSDDEYLNRIEYWTYDERNVSVTNSKQFFDLTGHLLQTQVRNHEDRKILATQPIQDKYDRDVISTLPAPISGDDFDHTFFFALSEEGSSYSNDDFDRADSRGMGDQLPGTLGWYYSENNSLENHVPQSKFPYSRVEYYDDGTGEMRRAGGPGEALRIRSGNETYSRTFGVTTELDDYVTLRNAIFGFNGENTTLANQAVQSVSRDPDGVFVVSFQDKSGQTLVSGLAVSGYIINSSGSLTISSLPVLTDVSYNFYDDAGRLKVSIAPNGVKEILANGINSYTGEALEDLPFTTYYTYNHQGWLLSTQETDAGTTHYKYRRDGSIRFSQNEQQQTEGKFSYTDYDNLGRPIESGEYTGTVTYGNGLNSLLEDRGFNTWAETDKKDWVRTHYDIPDGDITTVTGLPLQQGFVMGAVSWTENENITTWYSYDEQGRVTWMAQRPKALNHTFVINYHYDFLGNVLRVGFQSFLAGTPLDEFYHYYTYDADKRLSSVYTSLKGDLDLASLEDHPDAELQARYDYYLHGPLKRIELGGNLQGIDFVYNIQGWLKQINHPDPGQDPGGDGTNDFSEDAFGMILNYYENNMNNLFGISQAELKPDPFKFHGLEADDLEPTSLAAVFDYLKPTTTMRDYSAVNPVYLEQLKELRANQLGNEKGGER